MSRRCDREEVVADRGVPWPSHDVLDQCGFMRFCERSDGANGHALAHPMVMEHLRERPVLPPWLDVTLHGRPAGRFSVDAWADALSRFAEDRPFQEPWVRRIAVNLGIGVRADEITLTNYEIG